MKFEHMGVPQGHHLQARSTFPSKTRTPDLQTPSSFQRSHPPTPPHVSFLPLTPLTLSGSCKVTTLHCCFLSFAETQVTSLTSHPFTENKPAVVRGEWCGRHHSWVLDIFITLYSLVVLTSPTLPSWDDLSSTLCLHRFPFWDISAIFCDWLCSRSVFRSVCRGRGKIPSQGWNSSVSLGQLTAVWVTNPLGLFPVMLRALLDKFCADTCWLGHGAALLDCVGAAALPHVCGLLPRTGPRFLHIPARRVLTGPADSSRPSGGEVVLMCVFLRTEDDEHPFCARCSLIYVLWRSVYSGPLPILK